MITNSLTIPRLDFKTILIDLSALLLITFTPAISHLVSLPIYLLEPMRIMLVLSIVHTTKKNSYLIALALPVLSFVISSHPSIFKSALIISELMLNVYLFNLLIKYIKNNFAAMLGSILISKIYYYGVKFGLVSIGLISGELVATPVYLQLIIAVVLSFYTVFLYNKKN
ncbi:MAG: hypothetical protein AB1521_09205 [Bacteroidota bacterium]